MIRGTVIVAERAFVEQSFGEGAWGRMLRELPPKHAEPLRGIPLAQTWYPLDSQLAMIDAGSHLFGVDDFPERLGAFNAEFDRNVIPRRAIDGRRERVSSHPPPLPRRWRIDLRLRRSLVVPWFR